MTSLALALAACLHRGTTVEEPPLARAPAALVEVEVEQQGQPPPEAQEDGERSAIGRVLAASAAQAGACYQQAVERDPDLWGELAVRVEIAPDGSVRDAAVRYATIRDAALQACVVEVVRGLAFPPPGRPLLVSYPFVFVSDRTPPEVRRAMLLRHGLLVDNPEEEDDDRRRRWREPGPTDEGWWETW